MSNEHAGPAGYSWACDTSAIDWEELSGLYRIAPLGDKPPDALATVFGNSMFTCFAYAGGALAGAGRALADGLDCAYIADVAVHPAHQGRGLGTAIINPRPVARWRDRYSVDYSVALRLGESGPAGRR